MLLEEEETRSLEYIAVAIRIDSYHQLQKAGGKGDTTYNASERMTSTGLTSHHILTSGRRDKREVRVLNWEEEEAVRGGGNRLTNLRGS